MKLSGLHSLASGERAVVAGVIGLRGQLDVHVDTVPAGAGAVDPTVPIWVFHLLMT